MRMFSNNFPFVGYFPSEKYTDLKLTTDKEAEGRGRWIPCHKVVMAAVSRKLEHMIDKRGGNGHIVVRNMRFQILKKVVEFVYNGSIEVEEGVDEEDIIDALDTFLIKFKSADEVVPEVGPVHYGKSFKTNIFGDAMNNNEDNEENRSMENLRISSVGIPGNEFNMLEEDLNLSTWRSDSSQINTLKSAEALSSSNPGVSLEKTTRPVKYNTVIGDSSTTSEDSEDSDGDDREITEGSTSSSYSEDDSDTEVIDRQKEVFERQLNDENDMLKSSSGIKAQGMEMDENNNSNLPEILSPSVSGSCRAAVPLKKNAASHSRYDNRKTSSTAKSRGRICDKKQHQAEFRSEFAKNKKIPEKRTDRRNSCVKCDFCDLKVTYRWYQVHLNRRHPTVSKERIQCEICNIPVLNVMLKHHMAVYHSNTKVTTHEERFAKDKETGQTKVKCDHCGKSIVYNHLVRHYHAVHPGFKLHQKQCGICGIIIIQVKVLHHLKLFHGKIEEA